jgi:hypothetical protein
MQVDTVTNAGKNQGIVKKGVKDSIRWMLVKVTKRRNTSMKYYHWKLLQKSAPELMDLLECLLGYTEARIREGDTVAPSEHAKEARELVNKINRAKLGGR